MPEKQQNENGAGAMNKWETERGRCQIVTCLSIFDDKFATV